MVDGQILAEGAGGVEPAAARARAADCRGGGAAGDDVARSGVILRS